MGSLTPIGLLLALAVLTAWLHQAVQLPARTDHRPRHEPDFVVEGARITQLDARGSLQYAAKVEQIEHFPDSDTTEFHRLNMRFLRTDRPALTASSDSAWSNAKGDEVRMRGNVRVEQAGETDQGPLVARMDRLTVYPDDGRAVTDAAVLVTRDASRIQGTGMTLDRGARTMVLKANVTGEFHLSQRQQ